MELINTYNALIKTVDLDGVSLSHIDIGIGPTLIFLPSFPLSSIEYLNVVQKLSQSFRCICLDIPNWIGKSYSNQELSFEEISILILKFINKLKLVDITIIGYSLSGMLSIDIVSKQKELFSNILLISSPSSIRTVIKKRSTLIIIYRILKKLLPSYIVSYLLSLIFKRTTIQASYYNNYKEILERLYEEIRTKNMKKAINIFLSFNKFDINNYKSLNLPVFIINAEKDPIFVHLGQTEFHKTFNIKKLQILSECDHNHVFFHPEHTINFILENFSKKVIN